MAIHKPVGVWQWYMKVGMLDDLMSIMLIYKNWFNIGNFFVL